ncbi:MAG: DUF1249 domain-containing protein [Methylobacter sp.]|nr:DUF1249 domain-containing protein [Methylobacter sp.]
MSFLNPVNKSLCLEQVCESNYQKIFKLIPDLLAFKERAIGLAPNNTTLHLEVIEHTPHTMTVELSYCFSKNVDQLLEPAVKIRIYLDAQLAEVLNDHARASVSQVFKDPGLSREIMNYKWRLNYFLQKWLDHCLKKDYRFNTESLLTEALA